MSALATAALRVGHAGAREAAESIEAAASSRASGEATELAPATAVGAAAAAAVPAHRDIPEEDRTPTLNAQISGKRGHSNPNRAVVNNCPYCGSEYLFPDPETEYAWQCRECCHVFSVKFHGQIPRNVTN